MPPFSSPTTPHLHIVMVGSVLILHAPPSFFPPDALVSFRVRAPEVDAVGAGAAPPSIQLPPQVVVLPLQIPQLSLDIKCGGISLSSGIQRSSVLAPQAGRASGFRVFVFVGVLGVVQRRGGDVGAASYGSSPAAVGGAAGAPTQGHGPFGVATRGFQGVLLAGVHGS